MTLLWAVAVAAALLAVFAVWRAMTPPAIRQLYELQGRIEALELRTHQVGELVTKRERQENVAAARAAQQEKRNRNEQIAADALALLQAAQHQQPAQPTEETREQLKARLRAQALGVNPRRH